MPAGTFTSGLMADISKTKGVILRSPALSSQRARFALIHQLGHFLMRTDLADRQCTGRDLSENRRDTAHRKEEMQANRFATGLLMPKPAFLAYLEQLGKPTLAHLPKIADKFGVTLDIAAARYVELAQGRFAILIIKEGVIRFVLPSRSFPPLSLRPGDAAPPTVQLVAPGDPLIWTGAEVRDWLITSREVRPPKMMIQILRKESGLKTVMLLVNAATERRADEEAEKSATQSPKFGRRSSR